MDVARANVEGNDDQINDTFYVRKLGGGKVTDKAQLEEITSSLEALLKSKAASNLVTRPKFDKAVGDGKTLSTIMGMY